jgi:gluconate 2-dehydrogenase gamma chain
MHRSTRRRFFREFGVLGAGTYLALSANACRSSSSSSSSSASSKAPPAPADAGLVTFSPAIFATLSAVCERLLPRDQDPGALDLGVPTFVDRTLATPELASIRGPVVQGLSVLDAQAKKRFDGRAFHEVPPADQDSLLATLQSGRGRLFDILLTLTLEGAFGDPKYGGNLGGRGFAMIGFAPDPPMATTAPHSAHSPHAP